MTLPLIRWLLVPPAISLVESLVDNVVMPQVTPKMGSVVYCDLFLGYANHSGIYIGNNQIVHLNGQGHVDVVSPSEFIRYTTALSIYVGCDNNTHAIKDNDAANTAKGFVGQELGYNPVWRNCHQFASLCVSGDIENSTTLLLQLKYEALWHQGAIKWRVWGR